MLDAPEMTALAAILPREMITDAARQEISAVRDEIIRSKGAMDVPTDLVQRAAKRALGLLAPSLRRVINATGVIIHTNLGRSPLAKEAVDAVVEAATGYSTLEYDVKSMARGSRHAHCEKLICALTGAEAAIAVNNNAAAVLMVLSEFAAGKEAVVSRGELVEIGGSFRIPDIMALSGAKMVEVGTTNKTHAYDYERAITPETAMLLKVHTSNYRLVGFTEAVSAREMRRIADQADEGRDARILVFEDLGSGALLPSKALGDNAEPTAGEALKLGCDLVSFSGDKLLGGPQAGIVIGSKKLIDRLKSNPLARAMRLDKMTLAALEATLRLYLDPERAREEIPTLKMLEAPAEKLRARAEELARKITAAMPECAADVDVVEEVSRAGGGSLPMYDIPTYAVRMRFRQGDAQSCEEHLVKHGAIPIVARIKHEAVLFDVRTLVRADEADDIAASLKAYFAPFADGNAKGKEDAR